MKLLIIFILAVSANQALAGLKGDIFECTSPTLKNQTIVLRQSSNEYMDGIEKKCGKHSEIQYDWESYSFFQVTVAGKSFSGVACEEDVNFEFRSSNKFRGKGVTVWMYLDELFESSISINGKEHNLHCDLL